MGWQVVAISIIAKVAFSTDPLSASPVFTDISQHVVDLDISGGKKGELERLEGVSGKILLSNQDRRYDPAYQGLLTNLVPNPSFETDTAGWSATGDAATTLARVTTLGYVGTCSARVTATTTSAFPTEDFGIQRNIPGIAPGDTISIQARFYSNNLFGSGSGRNFIIIAAFRDAATNNLTFTVVARVAAPYQTWTLVKAEGLVAPANTASLQFFLMEEVTLGAGADVDFNIDAVQVEKAATASAYIDGSQPNARWAGTAHASQSYRGGPFYSLLNEMRRIQLQATDGVTTWTFFDGFIPEWDQQWDGRTNEVEIPVIDPIAWLATVELTPGLTVPAQATGPWIGAVLDDVAWPAGRRALDTGWSIQKALDPVEPETIALTVLQKAMDTEYGYLYASLGGNITMKNRRAFQTLTSQGTFSNLGGSDLPIADVEHEAPRQHVRNDIRISRDGQVSRAYDQASIDKNTRKTYSADSNSNDVNEPLDEANYILSRQKNPPPEFLASVTVEPAQHASLPAQVFSREFGERILVKVQPPGPTGVIQQDSRILSRSIKWNNSGRIGAEWGLERMDTDNLTYWVLGDATYGILGSTAKLAF